MKKVTYIKYLDSCLRDGEKPINHNFQPVVFEAVGFLVKEDDDAVTLARELNEIDGEENTRGTITIPKIAIQERYVFERKTV